ncbi:hypothetical protein GLW05_21560 [Pontibacillus yanchengensis]|uniref:Uncharacterized protein n=1 Tax=Pontibacillus yanchengensis TaxID=462910 RepID=A0A6I5A7T1_9BACI|nr:hypothetical protein [Pontibacillus yanchengensis]MYL36149.1 hypothetical protein [Pontibacillus yanchengensis]
MHFIDGLHMLEGYIESDYFVMERIAGHDISNLHIHSDISSKVRVYAEGDIFFIILYDQITLSLTYEEARQLSEELKIVTSALRKPDR